MRFVEFCFFEIMRFLKLCTGNSDVLTIFMIVSVLSNQGSYFILDYQGAVI